MRARSPRRGECRGDGAHRPGSPVIRGAAVPRSHRAASVSPEAVPPLRETAETVELPELVRGHERRIAALEDETRRLWRALAAAQKAQAL